MRARKDPVLRLRSGLSIRGGGPALAAALLLGLGLVLGAEQAPAQPDQQATCDVYDVTYSLSGNLQLADTPMGAGNGVYAVGPGKMVLRIDRRNGQVKMVSYSLPERFEIQTTKVFWTTHVDTDANAVAKAHQTCGPVAMGTLQGHTISWTTKIDGLRTDGTLTCRGSMCGKFGAPPPGSSPLHVGPNDVSFQPFQFGADGKTFSMASTYVSTTDSPKQTAYLAFSGRELRRACAPADSCP
jgi:hypothetical protein